MMVRGLAEIPQRIYHPPRLLLGVSLLFCGWMTGKEELYLVAALIVEASGWVRRRWDLDDKLFVRAWQLGWLMAILILMGIWIEGVSFSRLINFTQLSPMLLLPLVAAERFSKRGTTPVTTFSYFSRRKLRADRERGRPHRQKYVAIGYPFFIFVMIAASMTQMSEYYWVGAAILMLMGLWAHTRRLPQRWVALFFFFGGAAVVATAGVGVVEELRGRFQSGEHMSLFFGRQLNPKHQQTGIGRVTELKRSNQIIWTATIEEGRHPKLLRETTYSSYENGMWRNPAQLEYLNLVSLVQSDASWGFPTEALGDLVVVPESASRLRLRGEVDRKTVLPLPSGTRQIDELVSFEVTVNQYGCVRLDEPREAVINSVIWHDSRVADGGGVEQAPEPWDLEVSERESSGVASFVDAHQLRGMPLKQLIERLRAIFLREFTYSLDLGRYGAGLDMSSQGTAVDRFLNESKVGYCEYFATATALVLRECGFPSRYAVGFAMHETRNANEFVLRGTHAHAWVRTWNGESWQDVDLTPPDWLAQDVQISWLQRFIDWAGNQRQLFTLWRLHGNNARRVNQGIFGVVILIVLGAAGRLYWAHRKGLLRSDVTMKMVPGERIRELGRLERMLARKAGRRPAGVPVERWLLGCAQVYPEIEEDLASLGAAYQSYRFSSQAANEPSELKAQSKQLAKRIRTMKL